MSVLFRRSGSPFPEPVVSPFAPLGYGPSGQADAMRLDVVWACVRLLADTVAMLPLQPLTVKGDATVPNRSWATLAFLRSPAPGLNMSDWLRQMMISLLLRGNAFGLSSNVASNRLQIVPLNPDRVQVKLETDGTVSYKVQGEPVPSDRIFHMTGYVMPGDVAGMSPIAYAARTLQTQNLIDEFARSYFTDAPHPPQVYTSDKPINQQQAKEIKDRIQATAGSREPLILGLGLNMEALSVTPEESQFLATLESYTARICRMFGVPPEMIGGATPGGTIKYANVTQRSLEFLMYTVQHWLGRFEQSIYPLLPGMQHVKFDTSDLLRMTPDAVAKIDQMLLTTGAKVINEARADRGLAPVTWGDEPYLPGMGPTAAAADEKSDTPPEDGDTA